MKASHTTQTPEILLYNGSTGDNLSAQSIAVHNGRIVATGYNDDVMGLAGRETVRINLEGRLVLPGV